MARELPAVSDSPVRRYPLVPAAAAVVLGVVAARPWVSLPSPWLAAAAIGTFLASALWFQARSRTAPAACLALLALALMAAWRSDAARPVPSRVAFPAGPVLIHGYLSRAPDRSDQSDRLRVRCRSWTYKGRESPAEFDVLLRVMGSLPERRTARWLAGDGVQAWTFLRRPSGFANPGGFDYADYLERQGVSAVGFTKDPKLLTRLGDTGRSWTRRPASWIRLRADESLERSISDPRARGLLRSLLTGERGDLDPELEGVLKNTGVFHIIAISGLHVAILAAFLEAILKVARVPARLRAVIILMCVWVYAGVAEFCPSVNRSAVMATFLLCGRLHQREAPALNSLGGAAAVILLASPNQILDPGFHLSFAAVFSLIRLSRPITDRLARFRVPRPVGSIVAASIAASAGTFPLTAWYFHRVTPAGVVYNLIAVPLSGVLILLGVAVIAADSLWSEAARLIGSLTTWAAWLLAWAMGIGGLHETTCFRVPPPAIPALVLFYGAFLLFIRVRRFRALWFVLWTLTGVSCLSQWDKPEPQPFLELSLLDVGAGEAILVELPDRTGILIDGGAKIGPGFDLADEIILPVLWHEKVTRLRSIVVTHGHDDHVAGLAAVIRRFGADRVLVGPCPEQGAMATVLAAARARAIPVSSLRRGMRLREAGAVIDVLGPPRDGCSRATDQNSTSLVLRLRYGRRSFLLTGDMDAAAEQELLPKLPADVRCSVLKAAHHGRDTSSSPEFLDFVRPPVVLISTGYSSPVSAAVLERCRELNAIVLRTDESGMVTVSTDGRTVRLRRHTRK